MGPKYEPSSEQNQSLQNKSLVTSPVQAFSRDLIPASIPEEYDFGVSPLKIDKIYAKMSSDRIPQEYSSG